MATICPALFESYRNPADPENDAVVLNAMFNYAEVNANVTRLSWRGQFRVRSPVYIRGAEYATQEVGALEVLPGFPAASPVAEILAPRGDFQGALRVKAGGSSWANRLAHTGVRLVNFNRGRADGFIVQGVQHTGVLADGTVISADLGSVVAMDCGSTSGVQLGHVSRVDRTVTDIIHSTHPPTSVAQFCTVYLNNSDHIIQPNDIVVMNDAPYIVLSAGAFSADVYPRVPDSGSVVMATLVVGAGLAIDRRDATGCGAQRVNAMRCGEGLRVSGLYGGPIGSVVAEFCGIGIRIGASPGAAHLGSFIAQRHLEACAIHILQTNRGNTDVVIGVDSTPGGVTRRLVNSAGGGYVEDLDGVDA